LRYRSLKLGLVVAGAFAAALPIVAIQPAYADYAPNHGDIVGVGSDTLQYMVDFMADGDAYGDTGYNQLGNKFKLDNVDATTDANARLAYGVDGGQAAQATCTPSTGSASGTGNATTTNTGVPCVLNPSVVLRAGLQPVQRPNGSGAGFKALVQDMVAGHNTPSSEVINFSRASATQSTTATLPTGVNLDQLSLATDTLPLIDSGAGTHAVALSPSQLSIVYAATSGSCITWSDPRISGVWLESAVTNATTTITFPAADPQQPTAANVGWVVQGTGIPTGDTVASVGTNSITLTTAATGSATENVGLVNPSASTDAIIPLIPQVGSGTRSFFLGQLVPTLAAPGTCAQVSEENDPTAPAQTATPADAIEPMSLGRLDLYQGKSNTGVSEGLPATAPGYFQDPSCAYLVSTAACGTGSVAGGTDTYVPNSVNPTVTALTTGTPVGLGAYTGTGQGGGLFNPTRTLYMYFRNSDITSTTAFQPGTSENWLNTLFYDPCQAGQVCTGPGGIFGPAGAPYIQSAEGQLLLEDSGVTPLATEVCTDITTSTAC
jgi:hypothetical protein